MLTLSLLRHGKSSSEDGNLDDHERPLSARGRSAAEAMGAYLAAHGPRPDLVMCSSAARTRQTLDQVLLQLGPPAPRVAIDAGLYLAPASAMLDRLRRTEAKIRSLMLIAHNPGVHALALELAGSGQRRDIAAMATKFPTCGLAVLAFETEDWADVRPIGGRLALFLSPRSLA